MLQFASAELIELPTYTDIEKLRPSPPQNFHLSGVIGEASFAAQFDRLRDPDPVVRKEAANMLDQNARSLDAYVPALVSAATNQDAVVRRYVTSILYKLGPKAYAASSALVKALSDNDPFVRANAAASFGSMGSSGSFALTNLSAALSDSSNVVRHNAAGAIANIAVNFPGAQPVLEAELSNPDPYIRSVSFTALGNIIGVEDEILPVLLRYVTNSSPDIMKQALSAISTISLHLQDQGKRNSLPLLRVAEAGYKFAAGQTNINELAVLERAIRYLELLPADSEEAGLQKLAFAGPIPTELLTHKRCLINGLSAELRYEANRSNNLYYLGKEGIVKAGLNFLSTGERQFLLWLEENKLRKYELPYSQSFAVIAAIDDYGRNEDPQHRGPTAYPPLTLMVDHAKALSAVLQELGFPRDHIIEFYNQSATSSALTTALYRFWSGGDLSKVNRVFFYFGGHGDALPSPCLITYDFDKSKPTLTTLLMRDITGRHFENIVAHHFLVAIDSCSAGLALPKFLDVDLDENRLRAFRDLSIIESETQSAARNILVSGSGDQRALWENGGIFTKALVEGLRGNADLNNDGIIQFEELALFIKNEVRATARRTGVIQEPTYWRDDRLGRGNVIFLVPHRFTQQ